jgi:flagellar biosynthesis protein FlhA
MTWKGGSTINRIYDYGVAMYLVSAIVMLIIPIPAVLMDVLLSFDMALSFAILFTAMFVTEVLDMSFFPFHSCCLPPFSESR